MQIQRVSSLLQGEAVVRNWIVQHIPLSGSLAGYDLFLKISNDFIEGGQAELSVPYGALPHSEAAISEHVAAMAQAGLLNVLPGGPADAVHIKLTAKFVELLKQFQIQFESQFIPRKDLREQQLLVTTPDARLKHLAVTMYDHFYDIGWLYLHNYGGACFLMSSLVCRVAQAYGFKARVESCHVEIKGNGVNFNLGSPGYAKPGQIEGHAVCIIDEALLVDFGLGNVRRNYRRDFYWGLAQPYEQQGAVMAQMTLPQGESVTWKNDWQTPDGPAELAKYAAFVEEQFQQFVHHFG